MPAKVDLSGQVFGRLMVTGPAPSKVYSGKPVTCWTVRCECGATLEVPTMSLRSGNTRSCGCLHREHEWASPGPNLHREEHPQWKGDDISYVGIHARVRRERGRAISHTCVDCQSVARHWSYHHHCKDERLSDTGRPFCPHVEHYSPRCVPCHSAFDAGES